MTRAHMLLSLLALPLAACGGSVANNSAGAASGNASAATGSAAGGGTGPGGTATATAGDAPQMQPGEWEVAVTAEGAPALPSTRICITPEQVAQQGAAGMLTGGPGGAPGANGMTCDQNNMSIAGGQVNGTASCRANGMTMTIQTSGSISPTDYDIRQRISMGEGAGAQQMSMHTTARRLGECTADTPRAPSPAAGGTR